MVEIRRRGQVAKLPRFEKKFERTEGCWEWKGFRNPSGYGVMRSGGQPGRLDLAHRLSWELFRGPIPDGMLVLHHCDNRPCVRPDHLFLGTVMDNIRDMDAKGRRHTQRGTERWNARFSEEDILSIRARAPVEGNTALAREFGVTRQAIYYIVTRRNWGHL